MESDADENFEHLYDESSDAHKHEKLVDKLLKLNKNQNLKKSSRTEPTLQISEFNLVKSSSDTTGSIELSALTKTLKDRKSRVKINEKLNRVVKAPTLPRPLEKPQADRIRRTVAYEKTRLELDRWEATVESNRAAPHLSFPLDSSTKLERKNDDAFSSQWRLKSPLEKALEQLEPPKVEQYNVDSDEKAKFPLTMKEMLAKRKEAAKLRAFQGYKEAKARRQHKIKSKKYHRIQKKQKIKLKLKEFEELQKTDPDAALEKLEEIEKARVHERFSLRHKSTGQWAKNKQIRAKYDKDTRQELAQQLSISKELTQKRIIVENSDEDEPDDEVAVQIDRSNPWVNGVAPDEEMKDFIGNYRKFWTENNKNLQNDEIEAESEVGKQETKCEDNKSEVSNETQEVPTKKIKSPKTKTLRNEVAITSEKAPEKKKSRTRKSKKISKLNSTSDWEVRVLTESDQIDALFSKAEAKAAIKRQKNLKKLQDTLNEKKPKKKTPKPKLFRFGLSDLAMKSLKNRPIIDEALNEAPERAANELETDPNLENLKKILSSPKPAENIDPNRYIKAVKTNLATAIPDLVIDGDENEPIESQRDLISEAFEDDDLVDDFEEEKKKEVDKNLPKNVDLSLPGWGAWGGVGIKVNKRKKRRFIIKTPKIMPRKDDNKGALIINEEANKKARAHQVSEIPFPFKTIQDYEASIRAPISNSFVPETAFRKFIRPAVTTQIGAIIEPMSKNILVNK